MARDRPTGEFLRGVRKKWLEWNPASRGLVLTASAFQLRHINSETGLSLIRRQPSGEIRGVISGMFCGYAIIDHLIIDDISERFGLSLVIEPKPHDHDGFELKGLPSGAPGSPEGMKAEIIALALVDRFRWAEMPSQALTEKIREKFEETRRY